MVAVKAYYDGRALIPFDKINIKLNQQAIIVIEDNIKSPVLKKSAKGIASKYANPALIAKEESAISQAFSGI